MKYTYPDPQNVWPIIVAAVVVIMAWAGTTIAKVRQRTFWAVAVPVWALMGLATLTGVFRDEAFFGALGALFGGLGAMALLVPVSLVVTSARQRRQ